jgi:hypothetical protein
MFCPLQIFLPLLCAHIFFHHFPDIEIEGVPCSISYFSPGKFISASPVRLFIIPPLSGY